jgi:putative restriction endonuclease
MEGLEYYIKTISRMRTDSGKSRYPATTRHRAPHKPILMLSIFDLFDQGELTTNFVTLSHELADVFASYLELAMPSARVVRLFLPFFHMKNDGFWQPIPHPGKEMELNAIQQIAGTGQLRKTVLGGQFDTELYELICVKEARDILREAVINTYFDKTLQPVLLEQARTNIGAHQYSLELLKQARGEAASIAQSDDGTRQRVRDHGFRKAVVTAYDHRCVLCGIRLMTYEGRTAATAAHIVPWSVSHNDDPRNGLCLCRLCHWSFDVGLTSITTAYRIRLSTQLNEAGNMPGYLSTLNDRPIFEPAEEVFNPDVDALKWHIKQVFLG